MKPYLVYEYLMRNSDENTVVKTEDIIDYLRSCEILEERLSIFTTFLRRLPGIPICYPNGRYARLPLTSKLDALCAAYVNLHSFALKAYGTKFKSKAVASKRKNKGHP